MRKAVLPMLIPTVGMNSPSCESFLNSLKTVLPLSSKRLMMQKLIYINRP